MADRGSGGSGTNPRWTRWPGRIAVLAGIGVLSSALGGAALAAPDGGAVARADSATAIVRTETARPATASALAVLPTLQVKGRAPMTGYKRTAKFGAAWLDVDHNGCDTRDDVLRRDLTAVTRTRCIVRSGVLADPYTRHRIRFVRGVKTSTAVQIDHVVSLGDAWRTGAQRLTQAQRIELANDPANLFAVDGPTNEKKGDRDAAAWLPPNKAFRCTYAAHQVGVKHAYGLWVTAAERDALQRVLRTCPGMRAPVSRVSTVHPAPAPAPAPRPTVSATAAPTASASATPSAAPTETASPTASASPTPTRATDPRYATCTEAKANHAHTPYYRGVDVEYAWYVDRDHDGIVCK